MVVFSKPQGHVQDVDGNKSSCEKVFESKKYRRCDCMDKIGKYEVTAFTKARQDITIVSQEGKRKLSYPCVTGD